MSALDANAFLSGCQRMIPLVLPEVTTMVQKLLTRGFPRAYRERLRETEAERALVSHVSTSCVFVALPPFFGLIHAQSGPLN